MRVSELSKELNVPSKDLIAAVKEEWGFEKTPSSSLTVEQDKNLRAKFGPKLAPEPEPAPALVATQPVVAEQTAESAPPAAATAAPSVAHAHSAPAAAHSHAASGAHAAHPSKRLVYVKNPVIVREFADALGLKPNQIIAEMMKMNIFAAINQKIEFKIAMAIAEKHGARIEYEKKVEAPKPEPKPEPKKVKIEVPVGPAEAPRPPVVTFMGHVDHGKTSLLDKIRNTKVAAGEDGGITQHIGAYTVKIGEKGKEKEITFLDTPGHEAFTSMRARGANLTDIIVVVVDAVDGIMPQTREAIKHAQAAKRANSDKVAIMVAINKVDLRAANPDRVKQQLQGEGIVAEDWGGDVICCPVSALNGQGIDNFLEQISVQAEILELKASPRGPAQGYVIEAQLESGMGPTATALVRKGTLKIGDAIVCGTAWGRVKALINHTGARVKEAGPSHAVKLLGLSEVPLAGSEFVLAENERAARETAEAHAQNLRLQQFEDAIPKRASLEDMLAAAASGDEKKELNIVLKCDVQGSLEALVYSFTNIKSDKVTLHIVYSGIGNITVNDVQLAKASNAIVVGFHVSKENDVTSTAKRESVEIRLYSIIYELIDEVKAAMAGLLDPILRETVLGHAEVREVFDLGKKGKVAGCIVKSGKLTSRARVRVKRKGEVLYVGAVTTLRRFQEEASQVREGQECGLRLDNFGDFQTGDLLEAFEVEKIVQQL